MGERLLILWHFVRTRWLSRSGDRSGLQEMQQKKLRSFLAKVIRQSPKYRGLEPELACFPVMTKADFLANFEALNEHSISLKEAFKVAVRAEQERDFKPVLRGGVTVGLSSGTSGSRHVFLVSREDRCRWAGLMLGRMLSQRSLWRVLNPLSSPLRIAFFLRASSNLYTTLSGRRIKLAYYDLTRPFATLIDELSAQQPHVLVAPATVLAELARQERRKPAGIRPSQIISVAEVLDSRDRAEIEAVFGVRVAEVYQATEGFLGCSCRAGRVHLNEEMLHVEPCWLDEKHDRFQPIITDFTRSTQWIVRYQLNDILRPCEDPCPCGRHTMSLREIEGRAEEVLWASNKSGDLTPIFPDSLRQALYAMPEQVDLYRMEQHGSRWEIRLRNPCKSLEDSVRSALEALLAGLELELPTLAFQPWVDQPAAEKQKRIRCVTKPA